MPIRTSRLESPIQDRVQEAKPFLKWAGGKRVLLPEIIEIISKTDWNQTGYHEPFLGGGALFFKLSSAYKTIERASLNDLNKELIGAYKSLRKDSDSLISALRHMSSKHSGKYFSMVRGNARIVLPGFTEEISSAARFIYLNRTCYNGLYRVNGKSEFNVPWNKSERRPMFDEVNLTAASDFLDKPWVKITSKDFGLIERSVKAHDLVYFDPPYQPLNGKKGVFNSYTNPPFDMKGQERLKGLCDRLVAKGAVVIVSAHNSDLIKDLYSRTGTCKYTLTPIDRSSPINCRKEGRSRKSIELLIVGEKIRQLY